MPGASRAIRPGREMQRASKAFRIEEGSCERRSAAYQMLIGKGMQASSDVIKHEPGVPITITNLPS
jgi:hypothetical protein